MVRAVPPLNVRAGPGAIGPLLVLALLATASLVPASVAAAPSPPGTPAANGAPPPTNNSAVGNFTGSIDRMVDLLGLAGGGILALVWARVALSWFSHDVTKKVQAKDRARDALVGTLLFVAAITGLIWGLAHWVLTGT
jgi:hypothetical protein